MQYLLTKSELDEISGERKLDIAIVAFEKEFSNRLIEITKWMVTRTDWTFSDPRPALVAALKEALNQSVIKAKEALKSA